MSDSRFQNYPLPKHPPKTDRERILARIDQLGLTREEMIKAGYQKEVIYKLARIIEGREDWSEADIAELAVILGVTSRYLLYGK